MNTRPTLAELTAFAAIVRHSSFRGAADDLGMSPSTLSHMMRALEDRLGLRLFNRTTRSVAPTEAGSSLFRGLVPILDALDATLLDVSALGGKLSGSLRINMLEQAAPVLMRRIIPTFLERHPDIRLELITEGRLIDIVADGFDAGVRLKEAVPQDMVAVPFGGAMQFLVVASPAYLHRHGTPAVPEDLFNHRCIRMRLPSGKMYRWEFERHEQELRLDVPGTVILDRMDLMVEAAARGFGLAYVWIDTVQPAIDRGEVVPVLTDWTPPFPGFCLYYPSHRLLPAGLRAFVDIIHEIEHER
ncbi:LysR family transcriptional regulator [Dyella sp.]|uniref:LysR family transcriptional regulator n=1 Tax=Dyella sp. TaxID=1869338 RepID=UPI002ED62581